MNRKYIVMKLADAQIQFLHSNDGMYLKEDTLEVDPTQAHFGPELAKALEFNTEMEAEYYTLKHVTLRDGVFIGRASPISYEEKLKVLQKAYDEAVLAYAHDREQGEISSDWERTLVSNTQLAFNALIDHIRNVEKTT